MTDIYIKIIDKCGMHRKCAQRQLPDNCTTFSLCESSFKWDQ